MLGHVTWSRLTCPVSPGPITRSALLLPLGEKLLAAEVSLSDVLFIERGNVVNEDSSGHRAREGAVIPIKKSVSFLENDSLQNSYGIARSPNAFLMCFGILKTISTRSPRVCSVNRRGGAALWASPTSAERKGRVARQGVRVVRTATQGESVAFPDWQVWRMPWIWAAGSGREFQGEGCRLGSREQGGCQEKPGVPGGGGAEAERG